MRKRKFIVGRQCEQALQLAQEKQFLMTVTNKNENDNWQVFKSKILAMQSNRMTISLSPPGAENSPTEPSPGQEIALTFKKGYNKCLFTTRVISCGQFELEPAVTIPSITIYKPEQIEKIQRRTFERIGVPAGDKVTVSFYPCDDPDEKYHGQLLNLSAGGLGIKVLASEAPSWNNDRQCQVSFVPLPGQEPIVLQSRFRHTTDAFHDGYALLGFQFVGLELTEQGRAILHRIGRVTTVYERRMQLSHA
jgi:c-di-GMP-binding flagellar brake protein YcgR